MALSLNSRRALKIIGIVYFTLFPILLIVNFSKEVDFQRFPTIFSAYLEMLLNGYVSPNFYAFPMFPPESLPIDTTISSIAQRVAETESYLPNTAIIHMIMIYLLDISPELTVIIPFGLVIVPISYLGLLNSLINREKYPLPYLILAVYGLLFLFTTKSTSSFYAATPGYTLIFIGMLCFWKFTQTHDLRFYLLTIIILISLAHYWHTALMILMILFVSVWAVYFTLIIAKFNERVGPNEQSNYHWSNNNFRNMTALVLISVVCAITFIHLWQTSYLDGFMQNANLLDFIDEAVNKLTGQIAFEVPYKYNYKDSALGSIYFISYMILLAVSCLMVLVVLHKHLWPHITRRTQIKDQVSRNSFVLLLGLVIAQVVIVFLYYQSNSINFVYIPTLFPMMAIYAFLSYNDKQLFRRRFSAAKIISYCMVALLLLGAICLVTMYCTNQAGETSVTKFAEVENSFQWSYRHVNGESQEIFADFNIIGKSLQYEAQVAKPTFGYEHLNTDVYAQLVGDARINDTDGQYVIIDHATMSAGLPIQIHTTRSSLLPKLLEINSSPNAGKIYQDSWLSIHLFDQ
ncbi:MAG: hypothetical protein GXX95_03230 [Methanomassiliicoccus sp.]|nr:hypothetical protein [Methanomassiliicoccus sp.]